MTLASWLIFPAAAGLILYVFTWAADRFNRIRDALAGRPQPIVENVT